MDGRARSPNEYCDHGEREYGRRHACGLVSDSDPSTRCDQEQQSSHDRTAQAGREEQGKPTDHDLTLTPPAPALDRPERQLCRNEEHRRHQRSTFVDRARPQAQEHGVTGADSHQTPGKKWRPPAQKGNSRNQEPDTADRGHHCDETVAGDRRVGDNDTKEGEAG